MHIRQPISIGNLLLDIKNYRIVSQDSQKDARDAIIAEQGKKLVKLATDIITEGLSPIDLVLVVDANDGNQNYIAIEGNRRITAINLLLKPELAEGTPIHGAFKKLNKSHADDHVAIAKLVKNNLKIPWIVSYDNAPEIIKLYHSFSTITYGMSYSAGPRYNGNEAMFFSRKVSIPVAENPSQCGEAQQAFRSRVRRRLAAAAR